MIFFFIFLSSFILFVRCRRPRSLHNRHLTLSPTLSIINTLPQKYSWVTLSRFFIGLPYTFFLSPFFRKTTLKSLRIISLRITCPHHRTLFSLVLSIIVTTPMPVVWMSLVCQRILISEKFISRPVFLSTPGWSKRWTSWTTAQGDDVSWAPSGFRYYKCIKLNLF